MHQWLDPQMVTRWHESAVTLDRQSTEQNLPVQEQKAGGAGVHVTPILARSRQ